MLKAILSEYTIGTIRVVTGATSACGTCNDYRKVYLSRVHSSEWKRCGSGNTIRYSLLYMETYSSPKGRYSTSDTMRTQGTAFEIQQQINEVESAMGGAYASIAESLQLPLSYILLYEQDPEIMSLMSEGLGTVQIVTGVNALGKSTKINNLIQAMQEGQALVGIAMQIDKRLDTNAIMDEVYKAHAIDTAWIKKSDEVLKQEAQAMQAQEQGQAEMQQAMQMGQDMMLQN